MKTLHERKAAEYRRHHANAAEHLDAAREELEKAGLYYEVESRLLDDVRRARSKAGAAAVGYVP